MTDAVTDEIGPALAAAAFTLADRLAAGGTLWAMAPGYPDHARHVAVEFVHPVVVGTRAVAAFALVGTGVEIVEAARRTCRVGDVAVLIGPATSDLASRCEAWGVTTIAFGWTAASDAVRADHSVMLAGETDAVRSYHLLWELAQVCLEHSDVFINESADTSACAVCRDGATLGEVTALGEANEATLRTACGPVVADASLIDNLAIGDLVLSHAGVVIGRPESRTDRP